MGLTLSSTFSRIPKIFFRPGDPGVQAKNPDAISARGCYNKIKEPLNQLAAALSGSFVPAYRFENLEIRKGFLQFPNLNLEQNPSLTTLAI
jgi:hypothetical protein